MIAHRKVGSQNTKQALKSALFAFSALYILGLISRRKRVLKV
jgi:hypothetical protein